MKKILALVLAFAMMFSTITVAFAEGEVSAEAKALGTIGLLEGSGDGVTVEYTATELNRLTAAIMILKLKGLYEDALKYDGVNNFADTAEIKWEDGKKVLAFVKDNPVGFGGNEKGEFKPYDTLSEQMLYKVLLENLGYKQNVGEVVGDFAWGDTLEFAESIGLKPAKAEKFTVDGLSKALVAALKTNMKDGKAWIDVLVENGKVDKDKAIAADLMEEVKAVAVAVDSVTAIGNTVVEVVFEEDVDAAALENLDNYSIEGLEIKAAVVAGSDTVRLETAAMTGGKAYTLVVGEEKVAFAGKAKVAAAPSFKSAKGTDTERVELVFDKTLDFVAATDVANYTIANVTIVKAEVDGDTVTLTTEGLVARKTYTVKVTNIKSVDGAVLKSGSKSFLSTSDTVAPKIDKVTALTNTRFELLFNEEVTEESATDIANYVVRDTKDDTELAIEKIVFNDDEDGVEITTESQVSGRKYEVAVNNIVDQSVLANAMVKVAKKSFNGIKADTIGPRLTRATAYSENKVLVEFTEDGNTRLDEASVLDANNYEFTNDLVVESVEKLAGDDEDFRQVMLTVSDIETKSYKLYVTGVQDEYENLIKDGANTSLIKGSLPRVSTITGAVATDTNKVKVTFADYVVKADAQNILNYSVNNDMGTPAKAKYGTDKKSVTLTFNNDFVAGKKYQVTVSNIEDFGGNVISGKPYFVGISEENDLDRPTVENVEILNKTVLRVTFSEVIKGASGMAVDVALADADLTLPASFTTLNANFVDEDGAVIEYSNPAFAFTEKYYVVFFGDDTASPTTAYADKAGNLLEQIDEDAVPGQKYMYDEVYGSAEDADDIALEAWEQISDKEFKLYFSEKMGALEAAANGAITLSPALAVSTLVVDEDDETILVLTAATKFTNDTKYKFYLNALYGPHGQTVEYDDGTYAEIEAYFEDEEDPYIENVEATYNNELTITFNEDISSSAKGSYEIIDEDDKTMAFSSIASDNKVKLTLTTKSFKAGKIYTLKVKTGAKDLYGNQAEKDVEFSFEGTNLAKIANFGTAYVVNGENFTITPNSNLAVDTYTVDLVYGSGASTVTAAGIATIQTNVSLTDLRVTKLAVNLTSTAIEALLKDTEYTATVKDSASATVFTVKFNGIIADGGITLTETSTAGTFEVSYGDVKAGDTVMYNINAGADTPYAAAFGLTSGDIVDVWVLRDGRIVYYLQGYVAE